MKAFLTIALALLALLIGEGRTRAQSPPLPPAPKSHNWLSQAIGMLTLIRPRSRVIEGL